MTAVEPDPRRCLRIRIMIRIAAGDKPADAETIIRKFEQSTLRGAIYPNNMASAVAFSS
ncbi:hypothetical protein [Bordetella sp. LUAb4]|uniref:hypothetical protein n=1 Tax=Bordetella sp. LUAb4 TaxID=2843195 RepID=UPI001E64D129|nr:hypothetical protein [Bordetella sp. LUAb4]